MDTKHPFKLGLAFKNTGVDVLNVTGWGHDATVDGSFFVYYSEGSIDSISGRVMAGNLTNWKPNLWPGNEWEIRLDDDQADESAWTPVNEWDSNERLQLSLGYLGAGTSGNYKIRMPLPPINVLISLHHHTLPSPYFGEDGSIDMNWHFEPGEDYPDGYRGWNWGTKGISNPYSSGQHYYGLAITLKIPINRYFDDKPYVDGTTWEAGWVTPNDKLDPMTRCEDTGDVGSTGNSELDLATHDGRKYDFWWVDEATSISHHVEILPGNTISKKWDGDRRLKDKNRWLSEGELSPFDIDSDRIVELPIGYYPEAIHPEDEQDQYGIPYRRARVVKHVVTHEIGHALAGIAHTGDSLCLMNGVSNNWKRDDFISDEVRLKMYIHNIMRYF
jgi:hypothetical protein